MKGKEHLISRQMRMGEEGKRGGIRMDSASLWRLNDGDSGRGEGGQRSRVRGKQTINLFLLSLFSIPPQICLFVSYFFPFIDYQQTFQRFSNKYLD